MWSIGTDGMSLFAGVTSGHIYRSTNQGGNWTLSCDDPFRSSIGAMATSESKLVAASHGTGLFLSVNGGATWDRASSVWTVEIRAVTADGPLILAGTDMLGVFRSVNDGGSFSQSNTGLTSDWIQAFTFCGDAVFAGSRDEGFFLSTNHGVSWSPRNAGLGSVNINALVSNGTRVFAGTADSGMVRSEDLGASWVAVNSGLPTNHITASIMSDGRLLAGTASDGVFASLDHGDSWVSENEGLPPQTHIRSLASNESFLFAGTNAGEVFFRSGLEVRWLSLECPFPETPVLSLWPSGDYLYAGLSGGGVWKVLLSEIAEVGDEEGSPVASLALGQNHPNPFNSSTAITLFLEAPGRLELSVFDAGGRVVRQLLMGEWSAGEHRVLWDGTNDQGLALPSGTYFCSLRTGRGQESRGMLLLR